MRDVNSGWLIRYAHANVASFFFIFVYCHIGRNLYYGSYQSPRILPFSVGVIILVVMMAILLWPNCLSLIFLYFFEPVAHAALSLVSNLSGILKFYNQFSFVNIFDVFYFSLLPFNKARTRAINRIGPHNENILSTVVCSMLGDMWSDTIPGRSLSSVRFQIEQGINNYAYIHRLSLFFYEQGYCATFVPKLVKKSVPLYFNNSRVKREKDDTFSLENIISRKEFFNYRLTLFSFTSLMWIHESFYHTVNGKTVKRVPMWIEQFITPLGLAEWISQDGSRQKGQGISLATNSFTYQECQFLANILNNKFGLKTSVVKSGFENQWKISIWKESMPLLAALVKPYMAKEMTYKLNGYL